MKEIGGFFELELSNKEEYHKEAIKLNYGRNALEYILKSNKYSKVFLPYYICNSVLEPIKKLNVKYEKYNIDKNFKMKLDVSKVKSSELVIYVNYFGICNNNVDELIKLKKKYNFNLCIDNTQAFFEYPKGETHAIYSARKFFGVPDGAYLYTNKEINNKLTRELGYDKSEHLLKRIDIGCSEAYLDFKKSALLHSNQEIRKMSKLSERILKSIDYTDIRKRRCENFKYIHSKIGKYNHVYIDTKNITAPMIYPFMNTNSDKIKEKLISNKVYVAQYWPNIRDNFKNDDFEFDLVSKLIAIPIDQRYNVEDINYIIDIFNKYK